MDPASASSEVAQSLPVAAIIVGLVGGYFHWVWNMQDAGGVEWYWSYAMSEFHGFRPVLAAMAYTYMGITGLASIYQAK